MPEAGRRFWSCPPLQTGKKARKKQGLLGSDRKPTPTAGRPLPNGLDPLVPLLGAGGRDPVRLMLALHHLAVTVRLAGFYLLAPATGVVELQAELWGGSQVRAGMGGEGGWAGLSRRSERMRLLGKTRLDKQQHTPGPRPAS